MWPAERSAATRAEARKPVRKSGRKHGGAYLVEYALVLGAFVLLVLDIVEVARVLYMFNTLQEVTRRGAQEAAVTDFHDSYAMNALRQRAVLRHTPGTLQFGDPVSDKHVAVDYLALLRASDGTLTPTPIASAKMPSCPSKNRHICTADPNDASCIRFVRVRICEPDSGTACRPVAYKAVAGLIKLPLELPRSTTIVAAESLGYVAGSPLCP
ncbi:MAG: TadE family protein [Massilia sp.]